MVACFRPRTNTVIRVAFLLFLVLLAGCSRSTGRVSGKVLYNGNPLPGGRLTFLPREARQNPIPAVINADGHYEATLPVGEVTIVVDNRELQSVSIGAPPNMPREFQLPIQKAEVKPPAEPNAQEGTLSGKYVLIPEKYYLAETSDLKHMVKRGTETFDIELK
jgi:hypothetical protein